MPAVGSWDNITSITFEKVLPKMEDNISKDSPLLTRILGGAKRLDGGKTIDKVIKFAHSTQGGSYAGLEVLDTAQEITRTRASWTWRQFHQPIVVSNIDLAKNGGESQILDLLATDMEEAEMDAKDKLATMFFADGTGNGSKDFLGLVANIDDGTNVDSFGGIARTTYAWWDSYYNGSGGALALSTLATMRDSVTSGSDKPTQSITTEAMWTAYEALLTPQARFNFTQNGYPKVDGGFDSLVFRGVPIVADEYCTSGYWYDINWKYIQFLTLKHPKFPTTAKGFALWPLHPPTAQDGQVGFLLMYGNLINTQPRRSGVVRGLS